MTVLWVVLGAAVGAPVRYLADRAVQRRHSGPFPFGILTVNVVGSFVLGLATGVSAPPAIAALVGTGFCGALTTYSTFANDTVGLAGAGRGRMAAVNAIGSALAGSAAAALGLVVGLAVASR